MKHLNRIRERLEEIIRKDYLDWPDWARLIEAIEIYFDLECLMDEKIPFERKEALKTIYRTLDEFGANLEDPALNAHYIDLCKHTLYFL